MEKDGKGVGAKNTGVSGAYGADGEARATGGGGSGSSYSSNQGGVMTSGAGASGTSYSGGSGRRRNKPEIVAVL